MRAMPGSLVVRCVTGILLVVALTDTRFVVYLNSFFTEPASMLALLFLLAAVLHAWRKPALSPLNILAIVVAGAALVLSKSQNAPLVVPIVALLVARRSAWGRLNGRWSGRLLPAVAAIALLFVAGQYLRNQPAGLDQINRYNAVFVEILGHSRQPADDLRALHLQPELAK